MGTEIARPDVLAIEALLVQGDLGKLSPEQRVKYYDSVCVSLGLNKLTQPFAYLVLNGKTVLYATKSCTEQLRQIHGVSIEAIEGKTVEGVYLVTAKGRDKTGRTDASTGAVTIAGLKGDNLANALMKAETKAKRRLTLSLCGLGMLDESELETIPAEARTVPAATASVSLPAAVERVDDQDGEPEHLAPTAAAGPRPNWQASKWPPSGVQETVGTLEQVSAKSGTTNGKQWTRYGVRVGEDWFNTFDATAAQVAEANRGGSVKVEWAQGKGTSRDLLSIAPDEIPF